MSEVESEEFEISEIDALRLQLASESLSKLEAQKTIAVINRDAVYADIDRKYSESGKYTLGDINLSTRKGVRTLAAKPEITE